MSVKASAEFIAANADHVMISKDGIRKAAVTILDRMQSLKYSTATWKSHVLHPQTCNEDTLDWIFLMDLLNFSFWHSTTIKQRFTVTFNGVPYTGYWSLCACIQRAIHTDNVPITDPSYWTTASDSEFMHVFRPDDCDKQDGIPLLDDRIRLLRLCGTVLVSKFNGHFGNLVAKAQQSAQKLVQIVIDEFGAVFDDSVVFKGRKVHLNKRVQILVADIWACFNGQSYGTFNDISSISMFADYRVPQALLYFGILEYSEPLQAILRKHEAFHSSPSLRITEANGSDDALLPYGHPLEVEIRGCSIWAVEQLVEEIKSLVSRSPTFSMPLDQLNPIIVDFYLWDEAFKNQGAMEHLPIHRTRSIYY